MSAAIPVGPGIWRVPTAPYDLVNSFLVTHPDDTVTIVDAGLRNAHKRILQALTDIGRDPSDVTTIALTHAHSDHAGGAAGLADVIGRGTTVHTDDAQFVATGTGPPLDDRTALGRILRRAQASDPCPVAVTAADGDLLGSDESLRVLHTPGHTPGHISLLHEPSRVLITGDAIWNMRSVRTWPVLAFCTDIALNERSAAVLGDADYEIAAFTHGPHIGPGGRAAVRAFLRRPRRFPGLW